MRAKRSLGQNFLINTGITQKIAAFAEIAPDENVLEIGPGKGILTRALALASARIIAIEKDDRLYEELAGKFQGAGKVRIVHGDILECELSDFISPGTKIVANLPYNIASQLIIRLVDHASLLSSVVVMVQKEVAERICSLPGQKEYSALSVLVSSAFRPIPGFVVGPNNFVPRPKVDSMVIKLIPHGTLMGKEEFRLFRTVVFCAFQQRRKMLRNSLLGLAHMDAEMLRDIAGQADVDLGKRPQDLSPEEYRRISTLYRQRIPA